MLALCISIFAICVLDFGHYNTGKVVNGSIRFHPLALTFFFRFADSVGVDLALSVFTICWCDLTTEKMLALSGW